MYASARIQLHARCHRDCDRGRLKPGRGFGESNRGGAAASPPIVALASRSIPTTGGAFVPVVAQREPGFLQEWTLACFATIRGRRLRATVQSFGAVPSQGIDTRTCA